MILGIVLAIFSILFFQNSFASAPIIGVKENIQICQDTGGQYLNLGYKPPTELIKKGFSVSYVTNDIFCQCDKNLFFGVTMIRDWKGCNDITDLISMNESQFIEELNKTKNSVSYVNGNIDKKYITILEEARIKNKELEDQKKQSQKIPMVIYVLVVISIIIIFFYFIYRMKKRRK